MVIINKCGLIFFDVNTLFISPQEIRIENFGSGRQLNKVLYSKETIYFTINLDEIDSLFDSIELGFCYVSNRVQKELKEKINIYFDVLEFYWDKEVKRFKYR